jgi:hypothetical protein
VQTKSKYTGTSFVKHISETLCFGLRVVKEAKEKRIWQYQSQMRLMCVSTGSKLRGGMNDLGHSNLLQRDSV